MVDKTIISAVAGSGKTHEICKQIGSEERNLIISFTRSNISNIRNEMIHQHGQFYEMTEVLTFSSFVYRWLIRPFEPSLVGEKYFKSTGVDVFSIPIEKTGKGYTQGYVSVDKIGHYVNLKNNSYYSSRMSKFIMKQSKTVIKKIISNLSLFFDNIYIDEIQDFRGNDFKLLLEIYKNFSGNILGVGDFFQHSVQKSNIYENAPFTKNKKDITKQEYYALFPKINIEENLLIKSRRTPECVCEVIREKLNIEIYSDKKEGVFQNIESVEKLKEIVSLPNMVGLIWNANVKNKFNVSNSWSACKGDTYENVCIVLTNKFDGFGNESFTLKGISQISINKLYVALTRATNHVYVVQKSIYDLL